jgi:hypothetical protein
MFAGYQANTSQLSGRNRMTTLSYLTLRLELMVIVLRVSRRLAFLVSSVGRMEGVGVASMMGIERSSFESMLASATSYF